MLDAQVVKLDGQVVWASTEPELLWALRGAGGSFGGMYGFHISIHLSRVLGSSLSEARQRGG